MYVTDTKMPYFRGKLVGGNRSSGRSGGITLRSIKTECAPQGGVVVLYRSMKRWNTLLRSEW